MHLVEGSSCLSNDLDIMNEEYVLECSCNVNCMALVHFIPLY